MPIDENAPIEVTALAWVPPMGRGFVRDLRVRWALEEIGLGYRVRLINGSFGPPGGPAPPADYRSQHPFGQVPVYREGTLCLFESGAIVMHIGEKDERLLPRDEHGRARALVWLIAALNSVEPFSTALFMVKHFVGPAAASADACAAVTPFLQKRLSDLSEALGAKEWLEDRFTIGDLMMVEALRSVPDEALIAAHANLAAYIARGMARPAFQRAMAAQLADFIPDHGVA